MIATTHPLEEAFQRAYSRSAIDIPVLPPMIDDRTYFNKAKDRREAMAKGLASEPLKPKKPEKRTIRDRTVYGRNVNHLAGSTCDLYSGWWTSERKLSIVSLEEFEKLIACPPSAVEVTGGSR